MALTLEGRLEIVELLVGFNPAADEEDVAAMVAAFGGSPYSTERTKDTIRRCSHDG